MISREDIAEAVDVAIGFVLETDYPVALRPLEIGITEADQFSANEQQELQAVLMEKFEIINGTVELGVDEIILVGVDPDSNCQLLAQLDKDGQLEYLLAPEGYTP